MKNETAMQILNERIREQSTSDIPLERLRQLRPNELSNEELIAILIGCGTGGCDGAALASRVLAACDNRLSNLCKSTISELMQVCGIGRAKAGALIAFAELSRRRQSEEALEKPCINNSTQAAAYLAPLFRDLRHEAYGVLYLGQNGQIIHFETPFIGGLTSTTVDVRLILKKALRCYAISIILCHNHVSGGSKPDKADQDLTKKIAAAARTMDIKVLDHIIIGENDHYSFADEGNL